MVTTTIVVESTRIPAVWYVKFTTAKPAGRLSSVFAGLENLGTRAASDRLLHELSRERPGNLNL
jgi:hypothetical protein